jgi:hypothetical protein
MYFGDDEGDSSSSSGSGDNSSDTVDLSDKQGVVDPADLKKDDPPEQPLTIVDPPSPDTTPPGLRGDDPDVAISGRTPDGSDIPTTPPDAGDSSSGDDGN